MVFSSTKIIIFWELVRTVENFPHIFDIFIITLSIGIIKEESAIVEIKTFPSLRRKFIGDNLYIQAAKKLNTFCLQFNNSELKLKKNHNYYFQVNITNKYFQIVFFIYIVFYLF